MDMDEPVFEMDHGFEDMPSVEVSSSFNGKVPPQAIDSEKFVLGAFLQDPDAVAVHLNKVRSEDFYVEKHKVIHGAMVELERENDPVDAMTVVSKLIATSKLAAAGNQEYLLEVLEGVASSANIEYHLGLVKEKSMLRRVISTCNNVVDLSFGDGAKAMDVIDRAEQGIYEIAEENVQGTTRHVGDVVNDTLSLIAEYGKGGINGVKTGFLELDNLTSGLQKTDFIVLAGRPGMGKTAFALSLVSNASVEHKYKAVFFSLEMGAVQLVQRVLCARAGISMLRLRQNKLHHTEMSKIPLAAGPIQESNMFIDDQPGLSMPQLRSKCRSLNRQVGGLDLVVIDYLQLMEGESKDGNRNQEVSRISRGLKMLAKELNVPVIALSQLNRKTEDRPGQEKGIPQLSDLRDSGAIEQDADMVWFVHRPSYYQKKGEISEEEQNAMSQPGEEAKLIIAKNRHGPGGNISLTFIKESASFHNYIPSLDDNDSVGEW